MADFVTRPEIWLNHAGWLDKSPAQTFDLTRVRVDFVANAERSIEGVLEATTQPPRCGPQFVQDSLTAFRLLVPSPSELRKDTRIQADVPGCLEVQPVLVT